MNGAYNQLVAELDAAYNQLEWMEDDPDTCYRDIRDTRWLVGMLETNIAEISDSLERAEVDLYDRLIDLGDNLPKFLGRARGVMRQFGRRNGIGCLYDVEHWDHPGWKRSLETNWKYYTRRAHQWHRTGY